MVVREERPPFEEVPAGIAVALNGTGVDVAGDFLCHHPVEVERTLAMRFPADAVPIDESVGYQVGRNRETAPQESIWTNDIANEDDLVTV